MRVECDVGLCPLCIATSGVRATLSLFTGNGDNNGDGEREGLFDGVTNGFDFCYDE